MDYMTNALVLDNLKRLAQLTQELIEEFTALGLPEHDEVRDEDLMRITQAFDALQKPPRAE
jgi:hypothetical protein